MFVKLCTCVFAKVCTTVCVYNAIRRALEDKELVTLQLGANLMLLALIAGERATIDRYGTWGLGHWTGC
jgi:hypothetical protein